MKRMEIIEIYDIEISLVNFLNSFGLVASKYCHVCDKIMYLDLKNIQFRCQKRNNGIKCSVKKYYFSVGFIFYKSRIGIKKQLMMIYEYSVNIKFFNVAYEYSIDDATALDFTKKRKNY
ncbi:hypothetical protein GVAV_002269 [Gurleya vavrai]